MKKEYIKLTLSEIENFRNYNWDYALKKIKNTNKKEYKLIYLNKEEENIYDEDGNMLPIYLNFNKGKALHYITTEMFDEKTIYGKGFVDNKTYSENIKTSSFFNRREELEYNFFNVGYRPTDEQWEKFKKQLNENDCFIAIKFIENGFIEGVAPRKRYFKGK